MTRILIADDNKQNRYMLHALLTGHGHEVVCADDGADALEKARRDPPAIIITDILMPVMDGFTLCRDWKADERLRRIPFVFYTATYTDPKDEEFALSLGADRFIVKPAKPDDFLKLIQETLAAHQQGRPTAGPKPVGEEHVRLKQYNEILIRKLEHKMEQLEQANRDLARQIAERTRAEEERERLATAMEQAAEAVLITDTEGTIQYVNPAFERMSGFSRDNMLGQSVRLLKSGEQDAEFYAGMWKRLSQGEAWYGRITNRRKDGRLYTADVTISPLRDEQGGVTSYVGLLRDVTREVSLEAQLRHSQKLEAVGQLAGGVAHDLNNTLTVLFAGCDSIRQDVSSEVAVSAALDVMESAMKQAAGITHSLLTFSRKVPAEKRPVSLCAVVKSAARILERTLPASIQLDVDASCHPAPWVDASETQLVQALLNLVINARDAMPDGGTLQVGVSRLPAGGTTPAGAAPDDEFACLTVSDSGSGMSDECQARILEPFFTTKERGRGTGLGLSIVHSIVADHGGSLEIESEVGVGSTFRIMLPHMAPESSTEGQARAEEVPAGRGELILLAEDNAQVSASIAGALEALGYQVTRTPDGEAFLEQFKIHRAEVGLLILDVDLPKRSGLECLRAIRARGAQMPAIVITGSTDAALDECMEVNSLLLRKPFQMSELGKHVRAMLDAASGLSVDA